MTKMSMAQSRRQGRFWNPTSYDYNYHPYGSDFIMLGLHSTQQSNYIAKLDKKHMLPMWALPSNSRSIEVSSAVHQNQNIEICYNPKFGKFFYTCNVMAGTHANADSYTPVVGRIENENTAAFTSYTMPAVPAGRVRGHLNLAAMRRSGTLVAAWVPPRAEEEDTYYDIYGISNPNANLGLTASYDEHLTYLEGDARQPGEPMIRAAAGKWGDAWVVSGHPIVGEEPAVTHIRQVHKDFTAGIISQVPGTSLTAHEYMSDIGVSEESNEVVVTKAVPGESTGALVGKYDISAGSWKYTILNDSVGIGFSPNQDDKISLGFDCKNNVFITGMGQQQWSGSQAPQIQYSPVVRLNGDAAFNDDVADEDSITMFTPMQIVCGTNTENLFGTGVSYLDPDWQCQAQMVNMGGLRGDGLGNVFVTGFMQFQIQLMEEQGAMQIQGPFISKIRDTHVHSRMFAGQMQWQGTYFNDLFAQYGLTSGGHDAKVYDMTRTELINLPPCVQIPLLAEGGDILGEYGGRDVSCKDERGRKGYNI